MRRRAQKVGGEVEIISQPEEGTTISAWVPWEELSPAENDTNGTRKYNPFE
jgi:signal transduction histidine kinase